MDCNDDPTLPAQADTLNFLDDGPIAMDFEDVFKSNFSDMTFEQELGKNNEIFEKMIFENDNPGIIHDIIDPPAAQEALDSTLVTKALSQSFLVQCDNCEEVFTKESFDYHVCEYDANKQLIPTEIVREHPVENEFETLQRATLEMLHVNQTQIKKFLEMLSPQPVQKDDKAKQSNHECIVCTRKFVHSSGLYRHYDKHIGEMVSPSISKTDSLHPVILCAFCGECFTIEQDVWAHLLKMHFEVLERELLVKFATTELQMEMEEVLKEPCTSEHAAKKRKLNDGEQVSVPTRNFSIDEFVRTIFVRNLYHCEFCSSTFASCKSLLLHVSKHEPSANYQCDCCHIKGLSLKDILLHRNQECVFYRDYRNKIKDVPCVWTCNVCDEEFYGVEQLIVHRHAAFHFFPRIEHKTNQLLFVCELCSTNYETATHLVNHLLDKHLKKPRISTVPETSSRVQKSPSSSRKGGGHQTSTRPRQYLCEICGKSYTQSSHLWQHLRFHQGIKPFECPHEGCDRKFTIRPDLNDHIRKCHTGERPYECAICGKRFLTGSVYYQHRLIHRGERRYGCEECGKRFYRADALKNHQLIHSGEKPYKCWVEGCEKSFRQRGDRDKHVKARHKNAPPMPSPPKKRMKVQSFGRGRTKNNTSLYSAKPSSLDMNQ